MSGEFSNSLIEASSKKEEFMNMKEISKNRVFTASRKTELEVSGRNVIHKVLDRLIPIYENLKENNWNEDKITGYKKQLIRAVDLDLRDVKDTYSALHSLTDFVSGMTDRYTVKIARMVSGS